MTNHDFALQEAPTRNAAPSASPNALPPGASLGATLHLVAKRKTTSSAKSKTTSKAFKPKQDAPFAAMPRPLGRDKVLAARAALLLWFSPAPRRAPRLGTPFGGASRAVPARPALRAGSPLDAAPQPSSDRKAIRVRLPAPGTRLRRGCPSAVKRALGERGFAPRSKIGSLATLYRLGPVFFGGSPRSFPEGGEGATGCTPSARPAGPQRHAPRWARKGVAAQEFSFF